VRVALLAPAFFPEVRRGGERIVRELAHDLLARGHEPRLITAHRGRPSRTVEDGLPIVRLPRSPLEGRLQRRAFEDYLTHAPLSFLELMRGEDDVAHATHPPDAVVAALSGRPAVFTFMGVPTRTGIAQRRLRAELLARATRECAATVVLSHAAADGFRRWMGVEARVIHPSVDLDVFRPVAERAAEPTILCLADPSVESKRVPLLVEAFRLVRRERSGARLLALRHPSLRPAEGMTLIEPRDGAALAELYSTAWVSALPSWGEAFGLVLLEALACGTPVVGSDLGAIPELVDRDTIGRLFSGDDPAALANALLDALDLAEDPSTRDACRARAADFSTERMGAAYEALYTEVRG
jgi:glycosyltransferase involved in cell wall biosynthesis